MSPGVLGWRVAALPVVAILMAVSGPAFGADLSLTVFGGGVGSGEFFRVTSDASRAWPTPGGARLEGIEVLAEVDESAIGGVRLAYALSPRSALVASVGLTKLNVTGQHRSGATNQVQLADYDKFVLALTELDFRLDLSDAQNTIYLLGGVGAAILTFDDSDLLDQTRPFLTLGAGYRWTMTEGLTLEFELRDALFSKDLDEEEARLNPDSFRESNPQHIVQGSIGWVIDF